MPKGTIILFFILTVIATLLLGINIGKKINNASISSVPIAVSPTNTSSVTITPLSFTPVQQLCSSSGQPCGTGFAGNSLGECCSGLSCKESGKPDIGGVCIGRKSESDSSSSYTDQSCGFTFTIPGTYIKSTSENGKSTIITDPENPQAIIAAACAESLPRPPLAANKIEAYTLDGKSAILYHDKTPEGNPRDEVIVKHPNRNLEIILAGYGPIYEQVLSSFKFIR